METDSLTLPRFRAEARKRQESEGLIALAELNPSRGLPEPTLL